MLHLASSEDAEVREAALRGLLELARNKIDGNTGRLGEDDEKLKQLLEERINGISLMSPDELGAAMEERQLVDTLWDTCYNEPSSLHDKGLLVLPGEDSPPPDVASKHFEPPLRARAAIPDANKNSSTENKQTPLLLGLGPAPEAANVQGTSSGEVNADEPQNTST
jgi:hsp70-interacting protein